ncbi:MAG: patatin-like phospholipase family protein [Microgenomates group bacterium]
MTNKKRIGLALGSGGPRGLAHIGVIKALLEHHIPIDIITGSSAGALIGGLYASLGNIGEVEKIATSLTKKDLLWVFSDVGLPSGILHGNNVTEFIQNFLHHILIESLPLPFAAIATDLSSGDPVVLTTGNLATAIHASFAIPVVFEPVFLNNTYMIDGGCSSPVPVRQAKQLGADIVIAVNLDLYPLLDREQGKETKKPSVKDAGFATVNFFRYNLSKELCKSADVTIIPDVATVSSLNLLQVFQGSKVIQKGYDATITQLPAIKRCIGILK